MTDPPEDTTSSPAAVAAADLSTVAVTILGIGSLVSEQSARRSFRDVRRFRKARVSGYHRIFNLVAVGLIKQGLASSSSRELASVACRMANKETAPDVSIVVSCFDVCSDDLALFHEREHAYDIRSVPFLDEDGQSGMGLLCCEYSDQEYIRCKCGSAEEYDRRIRQHLPEGPIWRSDDILPHRRYLRFCIRSALSLGEDVHQSMLDSLLADGCVLVLANDRWQSHFPAQTARTVRHYLRQNPAIASYVYSADDRVDLNGGIRTAPCQWCACSDSIECPCAVERFLLLTHFL